MRFTLALAALGLATTAFAQETECQKENNLCVTLPNANLSYCGSLNAACLAGTVADCGCLAKLVTCVEAPNANHASCSVQYSECQQACTAAGASTTSVLTSSTSSSSSSAVPTSSAPTTAAVSTTTVPVTTASAAPNTTISTSVVKTSALTTSVLATGAPTQSSLPFAGAGNAAASISILGAAAALMAFIL